MKKIALFILAAFASTFSYCQEIGGRENGQSSPKEVKPSELTKGAYTSDVNLFTGGLSTGYKLGSVSTPSGLSFTLNINHSSTFTAGDNVPVAAGIPYGEGWSLDLPTVTVNSEAYHKYLTAEMAKFETRLTGTAPHAEFNSFEVSNEAANFWFEPTINIPGVINERFIYKYTETTGNRDNIFVP